MLLRPVVERAILPTAAYVAGPGEFAYFAQVGAVAAQLECATPLVLLPDVEPVAGQTGERLVTLKASVRRATLERMTTTAALREALDANPTRRETPLQRKLERWI